MWYVVQVAAGQERRARGLIEAACRGLSDGRGRPVLRECFVPAYLAERKFGGEWRAQERVLFPGYVIADTASAAALNRALRSVPAFTRLLGNREGFVPLDRAEMALIDSLTSGGRRTVAVSTAVAEGDSVRVVDGPLLGREGWVRSIDRRKGTCRIEAEMFGRAVRVEVGLSVLARRG